MTIPSRDEWMQLIAGLRVIAQLVRKHQARSTLEAEIELAAKIDWPREVFARRHSQNAATLLLDGCDGAAKGLRVRSLAVRDRAEIRQREFPAGDIRLDGGEVTFGVSPETRPGRGRGQAD